MRVGFVCLGAMHPGDVVAGAAIDTGVAWLGCGPLALIGERVTAAIDWCLNRLRIPIRDRAVHTDPRR